MKRIIAVITVISLLLCTAFALSACGKKKQSMPVSEDLKFEGIIATETKDPTNKISFSDGIYTEEFKGESYRGTYRILSGKLRLTPYGKNYDYSFDIAYDEDGNVTSFSSQSRTFTVDTGKKK